MKIKVVVILLLGMCIFGYNTTEAVPIVKETNITQSQSIKHQSQLRIINSESAVKRGEVGVITIKGKPRMSYSIETSYNLADKTVSVIQWRTADNSGVATFSWIVSMKAVDGTYNATISGGGDILKTNHKIIS